MPDGYLRELGTMVGISISTHRDKFPVTNFTSINPLGFTQSHRTISGTLVFHTIDRNALVEVVNQTEVRETITSETVKGPVHGDQIPLFDIHIHYVNNVGMSSFEAIFGVTVLDFGRAISFQSLEPIENYSYMAIGYSPLGSTGKDVKRLPIFRKINKSDAVGLNPLLEPTLVVGDMIEPSGKNRT